MVKFTDLEIQSLVGRTEEARVLTYRKKKGYGFAKTQSGKDIFISSYQVVEKPEESKLLFGAKIKFKYGLFNEKLCATEVQVIDEFPSGDELVIKTEDKVFKFAIRDIAKVGFSVLTKNENFMKEVLEIENVPSDYIHMGYTENDFRMLFVELKDEKVYRFFEKESKLSGCGKLDVKKAYSEIYEKFFLIQTDECEVINIDN